MLQTPSRPQIHVYPLSRLVHAPARGWEKLLAKIEDEKQRAFAHYLPMREGVVLFCAGGGRDTEKLANEVASRALQMGGVRRGKLMAAGNEAAFRMFVDVFYPEIKKFKRSFLRDSQSGVEFEGILLAGSPHLEVIDKHGNTRYVFLHAAEWESDDLKAYLELLAVVIERKYGASASDLWCMDLKTGETIAFKGSKRIRKRCVDAAHHFARFMSAPE